MKNTQKNLLNNIFLFNKELDCNWSKKKKATYILWNISITLCMLIVLSISLLILAYGQYSNEVFFSYISSQKIMCLNIFPFLLLMILFLGIFGRVWISYFITGIITIGFSVANYYKLYFRDDPLYLEDLFIINEAREMASGDKYTLFIDTKLLFIIALFTISTLILFLLARTTLRGKSARCGLMIGFIVLALSVSGIYTDKNLYNNLENFRILNKWSSTQNYISRGFIYPFIHSITDFIVEAPDGYSENKAKNLILQYEDEDIPDDKKINVIAIMREAYVDFSKYNIDGLDVSGYDAYHKLQKECISGNLIVNIFAGGTIDSERCFLTGNYHQKNYRSYSNSYLWYLRQQGYKVEGSHPYYSWFYNRKNVNSFIGFDSYRFLENDYENLTSATYPEDFILYDEVYKDYINSKKNNKPYFSFVLNIQSHGPYDTGSYSGSKTYLNGKYSMECKNAMNNYMDSIMDGDVQLIKMLDKLKYDSEPVVVVLYSDHLPWMGDGKIFYEELGINLDLSTEEGFRNHYTTDYLIWANDEAKKVLSNEFKGKGPTISPFYLMNQLFEECSWKGPAFMQAMNEMKSVFPVVTTTGRFIVDDKYEDNVPETRIDLFKKFTWIQHYWQNEFLFKEG